MANNPRMFYAIQALGMAPLGVEHDSTGYTAVKGAQSVGITTSFNLEQVFHLGQLSLYENIEDLPDVEITVEKVIDGYALLEHLATPTAVGSSLSGRFNDNQCMVALSYYNSSQEFATGLPLSTLVMSGMFVSSINWTIPVEGNITEGVTLVGNDKRWYGTGVTTPWTTASVFTGSDGPIGPVASGGVQRRENVLMGVNSEDQTQSVWPTEIEGINVSGVNALNGTSFSAHIQNVNISVSLSRTALFELGAKNAYFRYADFPTEVTCSIETTATEGGDNIDALSSQDNLTNQSIRIVLQQGVSINLGSQNKLSGVDIAGGDTSGGNVTVTYNYSNFNDLIVLMPATDPAGLTS